MQYCYWQPAAGTRERERRLSRWKTREGRGYYKFSCRERL